MEQVPKSRFVDERGQPLGSRIESVLLRLLPRFQRQYPAFRDDWALTEVFEEAGRKIADRERRLGPIEKLHGYAWVTLRSVATSWLRRGTSRMASQTLPPEESASVLANVPSAFGSAEQVEQDVLLKEILAQLSPEERLVCIWKKAGFSSQEIAKLRGSTPIAVDTLFSRAKDKIRRSLGVQKPSAPRASDSRTSRKPAGPRPPATDTGTADGE
jgi:RNA polymerase sigma factor (sigma-70 family)